ncbi:MAG: bifunctional riboflavin kinase/FAD synthetase [Anaerolineales bacterium]
MKVIRSLYTYEPPRDIVLTIGSFDGIHRGHQHLLHNLVQRAQETRRLSAVLTFHPHPEAVVYPERQPQYLSSPQERTSIIENLGIDILFLTLFDRELAKTSARELLIILHHRLRMRELWIGRDFAMGQDREGDIPTLRDLATEIGYRLHVVSPLYDAGEPISSTRIRTLLSKGRVGDAGALLGRLYTIPGRVVKGAQRGRSLGFRTANLQIDPQRAMPKRGVYAAWAILHGERQKCVVNVGTRPTFDDQHLQIEAHLLDYKGDLYEKELEIAFVQRLRAEKQFPSADALIDQVHRDISAARKILDQRLEKALSP